MHNTLPARRHTQGRCKDTLNFSALKQRQLAFLLTRQLAQAQFVEADPVKTDRLWQEVAALDLGPDRIIALLYGVADHGDSQEMEAVDRQHQQTVNAHRQSWWAPPLGLLTGRTAGGWHRSAPPKGSPARL